MVQARLLTPIVTSPYFLFKYAHKLAQSVGQSVHQPPS